VERATRWLLLNRRPPLDIRIQVETYRNGVADVVAHLPKLLRGIDLQRMEQTRDQLVASGIPDDLAVTAAGMPTSFSALDICEVSRSVGLGVIEVAEVYFDLADRVGIAALLDRIVALPRSDRWTSLARTALRDDLFRAQAGLASDILRCGVADDTPEQRFTLWVERNHQVLERTGQTMEDIEASDTWDLATLSVALRVIKNLSRHSRLA
jgi:glutamate dehydrogenase